MEDVARARVRALPRRAAGGSGRTFPDRIAQGSVERRLPHDDHERPPREGHAELQHQSDGDSELGRVVRVSERSLRRQDSARSLVPDRIEIAGPAMRKMMPALTALLFASAALGQGEPQAAGEHVLRVCADPDNLPLSNARGEGYENKIAEQLAHDLGRQVQYTYFPQRMGFVRNTLRQKDPQTQQFKCDVIIGVPKGYELTATTRPYMRSTYALLFRHRPELESLKTADDLLKLPPERLRALRIGVFG